MKSSITLIKLFVNSFLLVLLGVSTISCNLGSTKTNTSPSSLAEAEVVFQVSLPSKLTENNGIALEILDEVTGLAFNPTRYQMQPVTDTNYFVRITLPIGAIVKYRFSRLSSATIPEYSTQNQPVRYRLIQIIGPAVVQDSVAAWMDQPFVGETGVLRGHVFSTDNSPVPGMIISASGNSTITTSDGSFQLDGIAVGTHLLVALSPEGTFSTFQQGAVIAANATTPADFVVSSNTFVNITFVANLPEGDYSISPIRLVGSLSQLGNSFKDENGGFSVLPLNAPVLGKLSDRQFAVTIPLPVGSYIEYKYTLGDGFWNAEHTTSGSFALRKIVIPNKDTILTDQIDNWGKGTNAPITFTVQVPASFTQSDFVSVQFNPFTWTNSLPMWNVGNNTWTYTLHGPLDILGQVSYRYCRNDLCGPLDTTPIGARFASSGAVFTPSTAPQSFNDMISE